MPKLLDQLDRINGHDIVNYVNIKHPRFIKQVIWRVAVATWDRGRDWTEFQDIFLKPYSHNYLENWPPPYGTNDDACHLK